MGWEIKRIEDFATEIYLGNEISREQLGTGNYPAVKCGDITSDQLSLKFKKCISFVDLDLIERKKFFKYGDLLVANFSDYDKVGKASVYLGEEECLAGKGVTVIKHNQNPKYLSYVWSCDFVRDQIVKNSLRGIVFNFWSEKIKLIQVPLPPLEEQERIVEILDKFYDLTENPDKGLNNLIKLNQKQYEYYRNLIFDQMKI